MYVHRGYNVAARGPSKSLALRILHFQLWNFVLFAMESGVIRHFKDFRPQQYYYFQEKMIIP